MIVQAEASLYPLKTDIMNEIIKNFIDDMKDSSLEVKIGPMSSRIVGELTEVFSVLSIAFARTTANCQAVLTLNVSNACPSDIESTSGDSHA